jgi:hypothetical protein
MRFIQTAPGPVWLQVASASTGHQRFAAPTLAELALEFPRGPLSAHVSLDGALFISGPDEVLGHSANIELEASVPPDIAAEKAARQAALEAAWVEFATPERLATLLHGREVYTQNRPSLAWLRATPPTDWPPIFLRWNGDRALLMGGCHRVRVARDLGITEIRGRVHAGPGIVYDGLVGV